MNKLLKLSAALVLLGCINYSAYSTALESGYEPLRGQPNTYHNSYGGDGFVTTLPVGTKVTLFAPVPGQPNTYQLAIYLYGHTLPPGSFIGGIPIGATMMGWVPVPGQSNTYKQASYIFFKTPAPSNFLEYLPVGAQVLNPSDNSVIPAPPIPIYSTPLKPVPQPAPVPVTPAPAPVATSIPMPPSPTDPDSKSVEWMPAQYYRFTGPRGNKIYVDDNNGNAYVQLSNGTKNNLSPYSSGKYMTRPAKYQVPGWLLAKWTQNPADKGKYFIAAGNGNSSNRMLSMGPDGALQVEDTTQNQRSGPNGIVHQVPPAKNSGVTTPAAVNSQPTAAKLVAPASVTASSVPSR